MMYCRQLSILLCVTFASHVKVYREKRTTNSHTIQQLFLFLLLLCYAIYSYIACTHESLQQRVQQIIITHQQAVSLCVCVCVCVLCVKEEGKEQNGKNDNINSCIDSLSLLSTHHVLLYNNTARVYTTSYSTSRITELPKFTMKKLMCVLSSNF